MRNILIAAAAATAVALASAPAGAADNWGPTKVGNECFKPAPGGMGRDLLYGSWGACPQPASITPAPKSKKR